MPKDLESKKYSPSKGNKSHRSTQHKTDKLNEKDSPKIEDLMAEQSRSIGRSSKGSLKIPGKSRRYKLNSIL